MASGAVLANTHWFKGVDVLSLYTLALVGIIVVLPVLPSFSQTTQGVISGRVVDSQEGTPVQGCQVSYWNLSNGATGAAKPGTGGYFVLPLLSPGVYRISIRANGYQSQEIHDLELGVAGSQDVNIRLRRLRDVWERGQFRTVFLPGVGALLTFFGPDLDATHSVVLDPKRVSERSLQTTVSQVIDPVLTRDLPLGGRDVYATLIAQPGFAADTATSRGLTLASNGQRPSSSSFLLDGLENNNYAFTGPLTVIAPEAIQEYRISTGIFSAEYGRTSGFLANAVTRSGGPEWHGLAYYNLKNEALNANGFQQNLLGLTRQPDKLSQFGFQAGGPVYRKVLYASTAYDLLRTRGHGDTVDVSLPTLTLRDLTRPASTARHLLDLFPPIRFSTGNPLSGMQQFAIPVSVDRTLLVERIDYRGRRNHAMARVARSRFSYPNFIWSPYPDFVSGLDQHTTAGAISAQMTLSPTMTNEARAGWGQDQVRFDRAHPEIPKLVALDMALPGSPADYSYRNRGRNLELAENLLWTRGRHMFKAGAGALVRRIDGALTEGRDGLIFFRDALGFAVDLSEFGQATFDRVNPAEFRSPGFERHYGYSQYNFFVQDMVRVNRLLTIDFGVRYESFGAPRNTGALKDIKVELGSGASLPERIANAILTLHRSGDESLFDSDRNDVGVRLGFSLALSHGRGALLRGGYGIFYDRPFDNQSD